MIAQGSTTAILNAPAPATLRRPSLRNLSGLRPGHSHIHPPTPRADSSSENRPFRAIEEPEPFSRQYDRLVAPMARRCWKHSRQYTGRPCVGLKGTVVSFPHCEQVARVSILWLESPPEFGPGLCARLALHVLHRLGSFRNPFSAKNICSPAVKTNSAPHSPHFNTLS